MIWKTQPTIEGINTIGKGSMGGYLDIEFAELEDILTNKGGFS